MTMLNQSGSAVAPDPARPAGGADARAEEAQVTLHSGVFLRVFQQMVRQPLTVVSLLYLLALIAIAIYVAVANPLQPNAQDLRNVLQGPSADHLFGTDNLGRDVFARMVHAVPIALSAIAEGVGISALLGIVPGLLAGFLGGWWDAVTGRVFDVLVVFPGLILALAIVGMMGPGLSNAMIAVGVVNSPRLFRVVRAATMGVRDSSFVDAARIMGAGSRRIIRSHIAANVAGPTAVQLAIIAAQTLLAEAGLSYLGLGVQAPQSSWGSMIRDTQQFITTQPGSIVFPGLAIMITAMALNFTADGIVRALRASTGVRTARP